MADDKNYQSADNEQRDDSDDESRDGESATSSSHNQAGDLATSDDDNINYKDDINVIVRKFSGNNSCNPSDDYLQLIANEAIEKFDDSSKALEEMEEIDDTYLLLKRLAEASNEVGESSRSRDASPRHRANSILNRPATATSLNMFRFQALKNRLASLQKLMKHSFDPRLKYPANFEEYSSTPNNVVDHFLESSVQLETSSNLENLAEPGNAEANFNQSTGAENPPNPENLADSEQSANFRFSIASDPEHPSEQEDPPGLHHSAGSQHSADSGHPSKQEDPSDLHHSTGSKHPINSRHPSNQEDPPGPHHSTGLEHSTDSGHPSRQEDPPGSHHPTGSEHSTDSGHPSNQEDPADSYHSNDSKHSADSELSTSMEDSQVTTNSEHLTASEHSSNQEGPPNLYHWSSSEHLSDSKHSLNQEEPPNLHHWSSSEYLTDLGNVGNQEDSLGSYHSTNPEQPIDPEDLSNSEYLTSSELLPNQKNPADSKEHLSNPENPTDPAPLLSSQHSVNTEHSEHLTSSVRPEFPAPSFTFSISEISHSYESRTAYIRLDDDDTDSDRRKIFIGTCDPMLPSASANLDEASGGGNDNESNICTFLSTSQPDLNIDEQELEGPESLLNTMDSQTFWNLETADYPAGWENSVMLNDKLFVEYFMCIQDSSTSSKDDNDEALDANNLLEDAEPQNQSSSENDDDEEFDEDDFFEDIVPQNQPPPENLNNYRNNGNHIGRH